MKTDYLTLTELWQDGEYIKIGKIINQEEWKPSEVAKFCAYFNKYLGVTQLNILYKFL